MLFACVPYINLLSRFYFYGLPQKNSPETSVTQRNQFIPKGEHVIVLHRWKFRIWYKFIFVIFFKLKTDCHFNRHRSIYLG